MSSPLPLPGVDHGQRALISVIEYKARKEPNGTWVSYPINENDLCQGFGNVSYRQLENTANRAAYWLEKNLPQSLVTFQTFAYAGPKNLRYLILAVAAWKLQKMVRFLINFPVSLA
jgi:acyl-CoA synthetase (AMP-forming)/AMP-acid ligase II